MNNTNTNTNIKIENNITSEEYSKYDAFVARTLAFLYKEFKEKDKIILNYNKDYFSDYMLSICFMYSDIENKSIYIHTKFLTYLKLKLKFFKKRKIKFHFSFDNNNLCAPYVLSILAYEAKEHISIAKKIYEIYYK